MSLKVIIACGGTGGHLFPGIAVAEALQKRGHECLVLISKKEIDALASEGYDHLKFEKLDAIGMPSLLSPAVFKFGFKMWKTLRDCKKIVNDFGADAVLGMGGFTSLPPVWAARRLKKKTFIHDSNSIPGKANRLTSRFADVVFVGWKECATFFPKRRTEVVGTPVRGSVLREVTEDEALACFGFSKKPNARTLLVMGGSQGAQGVNRGVTSVLRLLKERVGDGLRVIHINGKLGLEETEKAYVDSGVEHYVSAFCQSMECAYKLADLCVARSGASSMTELAEFGLPSILIPYPFAAEDHQTRNAEVFSSKKAAFMMKEADLTPDGFGKLVADLLVDEEALKKIGQAVSKLATSDAAENICAQIEKECQ